MSGSPVALTTERLLLDMPHPSEAPAVLAYFLRNRDHLAPWDPEPGADFFTEAWWVAQLLGNRQQYAIGSAARMFVRLRADPGRIAGTCNLSNIVRGVFQACHLGYGIDAELQGRGLMSEAVERAVRFAFEDLGLHRVMANYQPHNLRSARLLERLGFEIEGTAKDYLFLAGAWRDHVLTSRVAPGGRPREGDPQAR